MPPFIALAASRTSGTKRIPSRKSAHDCHAAHQRLGQNIDRDPIRSSRMLTRFFDLFLEAVIKVIKHLLDKFFVVQFGRMMSSSSDMEVPLKTGVRT